MPYTYTKLSTPTTIRLIQVMPKKVDGAIACIIHTHETQKSHEKYREISYRALSYRWGDPTAKRRVLLKDADENEWHQHEVHENLWQFLDHACHHSLFEDFFWTDYFCLDQTSQEELAQQIPRMGVIYAEARETVIWLGLAESEEIYIQSFIRKWGRGKNFQKSRTKLDNDADQKLVDSIDALWRNEYWGRLWIIQEVVLAKRATVMMRTWSIDLKHLEMETLLASPNRIDNPPPSMMELVHLREDSRRQWWRLLRDYISEPYQCTKPNDRIYGLLGLVKTPIDVFRIDYERPYSHVILDVVFEAASDWPPSWVERMLDHLNKDNKFMLTKDSNALEEYLNDKRTFEGHQKLAKIALQAFDAMSSIVVLITHTRGSRWSGFSTELSSRNVLHIEQEAIFLGLILGIGGTSNWGSALLEHWKTHRQPKLQQKSWKFLWRCKKHSKELEEEVTEERLRSCIRELLEGSSLQDYAKQHEREYEKYPSFRTYILIYMQEYERYHKKQLSKQEYTNEYMKEYTQWWKTRSRRRLDAQEDGREPAETSWGHLGYCHETANGCAQANPDCDASSMILTVPQYGFRMILTEGIRIQLEFFKKKAWTSKT